MVRRGDGIRRTFRHFLLSASLRSHLSAVCIGMRRVPSCGWRRYHAGALDSLGVIDMPPAMQALAFGVSAYAIGAVSAAFYVVRALRGRDIRDLHSGNAGATNAGRVLGGWGFALVFALDCLKGVAAVWLPRLVDAPLDVRGVAAFAVVAGHIWPPQLKFRGGKGIATAMGAVPAAMPWLALHLLIAALATLLVTRRTHWAGLAAVAVLVPFARALGVPSGLLLAFVAMAAIILWAHRRELADTWAGWRRTRGPGAAASSSAGPSG